MKLQLIPKSLWGRAWLTTALLLAVAQILTMVLFSTLILRPETERVAGIMAQSVVATSDTLAALPPAERARAIQNLGHSRYLEIWNGAQPPNDNGPPPRAIERLFMNALVQAMGPKTDLYWRTDLGRKLWIHVNLGGDPYWISIKSPPSIGPRGMVLISAAATLLLALAAAWVLRSRVLSPLDELRAATEAYRLSATPEPLREDGPTEIAAITKSFNRMTDRLARADGERNLVLAAISHDVRTPLAKLKLAFEMMRNEDESLKDSAQRQVDSIERILSQFMTFARGFEAEPISSIDANNLIAQVAADYADANVHAALCDSPIQIKCRPEALRRALMNLVENALRYGATPVEISLTAVGKDLRITVKDRGNGIPEDRIASIREPFVRGDLARNPSAEDAFAVSGTGLGLAIVDKIARLHAGHLDLINLPDGFAADLALLMAK